MNPKEFLDEIVYANYEEYLEDRTSRRLAFNACASVHHCFEHLRKRQAKTAKKSDWNIQLQNLRENPHYSIIEAVTNAYKHVHTHIRIPGEQGPTVSVGSVTMQDAVSIFENIDDGRLQAVPDQSIFVTIDEKEYSILYSLEKLITELEKMIDTHV